MNDQEIIEGLRSRIRSLEHQRSEMKDRIRNLESIIDIARRYQAKRQESYDHRFPNPDIEGHRRLANEASALYTKLEEALSQEEQNGRNI